MNQIPVNHIESQSYRDDNSSIRAVMVWKSYKT